MAQIQMENEMKQLAEMTSDSLRDIFDKVGRKNKQVAARINFERVVRLSSHCSVVSQTARKSVCG